MPADVKQDATADESSLREIEQFVQDVPPEETASAAASEAEPDLESVARDLGISVDEVKALREASLG